LKKGGKRKDDNEEIWLFAKSVIAKRIRDKAIDQVETGDVLQSKARLTTYGSEGRKDHRSSRRHIGQLRDLYPDKLVQLGVVNSWLVQRPQCPKGRKQGQRAYTERKGGRLDVDLKGNYVHGTSNNDRL